MASELNCLRKKEDFYCRRAPKREKSKIMFYTFGTKDLKDLGRFRIADQSLDEAHRKTFKQTVETHKTPGSISPYSLLSPIKP
jgi:hypothetical protein